MCVFLPDGGSDGVPPIARRSTSGAVKFAWEKDPLVVGGWGYRPLSRWPALRAVCGCWSALRPVCGPSRMPVLCSSLHPSLTKVSWRPLVSQPAQPAQPAKPIPWGYLWVLPRNAQSFCAQPYRQRASTALMRRRSILLQNFYLFIDV